MKICYLCADPGIPLYGRKGCSTHVRETCFALRQLGNEVKVLCSDASGDREGVAALDILEIAPPRSRKLGFDLRHILLDRRVHHRLEDLIQNWRPDAIYERYSLYCTAGNRLAQKYDIPRLLEINAFLTVEQKTRIRFGWLARRVEQRTVRQARRVIVVSEPLRRDVHELGVPFDAISKMPMAVNTEKFNPNVDGGPVRRRHGLENRFIIGYVGTLTGWHGLKLLHEMANRMRASDCPPFAFLIVGGEGRKLEDLRERANQAGLADHLRFIGSVPHDTVPEYMRAMDAAIIPDTTYWSSPAKLFEYQACGIPVLAPGYPAIHEALEHGGEGFIFSARDTSEMARMALELMSRPDLRRQMGENARRRAEQQHSWINNGREIETLFQQMRESSLKTESVRG